MIHYEMSDSHKLTYSNSLSCARIYRFPTQMNLHSASMFRPSKCNQIKHFNHINFIAVAKSWRASDAVKMTTKTTTTTKTTIWPFRISARPNQARSKRWFSRATCSSSSSWLGFGQGKSLVWCFGKVADAPIDRPDRTGACARDDDVDGEMLFSRGILMLFLAVCGRFDLLLLHVVSSSSPSRLVLFIHGLWSWQHHVGGWKIKTLLMSPSVRLAKTESCTLVFDS